MYNEHFGIEEKPFSMAPDPRYLYMSAGHREAFAHLLYGIKEEGGGFVLLSGEVGTGKTTVCRCLLEQLPEQTNVAMIFNPKVTSLELLASICDEFRIDYPSGNNSIKDFIDLIDGFLLRAHRKGWRNVLIIDEAQNLAPDVLEQIRLLTNLETKQRKLLQIILLGQPELLDLLSKPELRQLAQRVTAKYHLQPLTPKEVALYVRHRLGVAGLRGEVFPPPCLEKISRLSKGIPRLINVLCDRALLGAYVQGKDVVDSLILKKAAKEVLWTDRPQQPSRQTFLLVGGGVAVAAAMILIFLLFPVSRTQSTSAVSPAAVDKAAVMQPVVNNAGPAVEPVPLVSEPSVESVPHVAEPAPAPDTVAPLVEPVPLSSLDWPADRPMTASWDAAQQALFAQWQLSYDPAADNACGQAEDAGLRCLQQRGGLDSLLGFNRPAVLRFVDDDNREYYGTVTGIEDQAATIELGGEMRWVALQEMALRWSGEFTLLWKMPPAYIDSIRPGHSGPQVRWLDTQLAALFNRPASDDETPRFTGQLVEEVRKFQLAEGLVPDGIAGVQTIIRINTRAVDSHVPLLIGAKGDE